MLLQEDVTELLNEPRLVAIGSARMNILLEFSAGYLHVILRLPVFPEEGFRYFIHPLIRALRGENGDDEEVEGRAKVEERLGRIIEFLQLL